MGAVILTAPIIYTLKTPTEGSYRPNLLYLLLCQINNMRYTESYVH